MEEGGSLIDLSQTHTHTQELIVIIKTQTNKIINSNKKKI